MHRLKKQLFIQPVGASNNNNNNNSKALSTAGCSKQQQQQNSFYSLWQQTTTKLFLQPVAANNNNNKTLFTACGSKQQQNSFYSLWQQTQWWGPVNSSSPGVIIMGRCRRRAPSPEENRRTRRKGRLIFLPTFRLFYRCRDLHQ